MARQMMQKDKTPQRGSDLFSGAAERLYTVFRFRKPSQRKRRFVLNPQ
jgi:hypothetical protein